MSKTNQTQTKNNIKKLKRFSLIFGSFFSYTCFKFLQTSPTHPYIGSIILLGLFVIMIGSMFAGRFKQDVLEKPWFILSIWTGSTFMGLMGTYLILALPIDAINLIYALFNNYHGFLTRELEIDLFLLSFGMSFIGFISALLGPRIVKITVPFNNMPNALNGLKIAQISDLHIGPMIQSRYVKKVVDRVNQLEADIIVVTGDLIDYHTEAIRKHMQPLAQLKPKTKVFFCMGNHEYYWGEVEKLLYELEEVGMTPLINENRILYFNGAKVLISGIPDQVGHHFMPEHTPNVIKARETDQKTDLNILLAHRPDPYKSAEKHGFDLQFSGHTHGGQFFPFNLLIPLAHKYSKGLHKHGKMWLYISTGCGYWGPANRFLMLSEINLITIKT